MVALDTIKQLYNNPRYGLSSTKLYKKAKELDPTVTHSIVKEFLKSQETAQVFTERKVKKFYPLISHGAFENVQIDLADYIQENANRNGGYKWLFCAVDIFTRYAIVFPQKDKSEKSCVDSLRKLIDEVKRLRFNIEEIQSDMESAFRSRQFKKICADNDIHQKIIEPVMGKHPLGIVERFNKTIRTLINKYKTLKKTGEWVKAVPDLVANYNESEHRTLGGRTPESALRTGIGATQYMVDQTLKADDVTYNKIDIQVGDKVRLFIKKGIFEKGSDNRWTKTVHTVEKIGISPQQGDNTQYLCI